jgi:glycosyltransferase involved in cell wall biosynthesis
MRKKKILFVVRQMGQGGTERRLWDLKCSLDQYFEIRIANLTGIDNFSEKSANQIPRGQLSRLKNLYKTVREYQPDLVHAFDIESGHYYSLVKKFLFSKRVFISGYGASKIEDSRLLRLLRMKSFQPDFYICNSDSGARELKRHIPAGTEVRVIHNGLDVSRFLDQPAAFSFEGRQEGQPLIGYIGKFDDYKHGERMLDIAKAMENHPSEPYFLAIGDGPYRAGAVLECDLLPEKLKKRISMPGTLPNAAALIPHFTIGTLFSDSEGFPNALLEYMAAGKPWVSTNVGDVSILNRHIETGLIVENWNLEEFVSKLSVLLADKHRAENLGSGGKKEFYSRFHIDIMRQAYKTVYDDLLN